MQQVESGDHRKLAEATVQRLLPLSFTYPCFSQGIEKRDLKLTKIWGAPAVLLNDRHLHTVSQNSSLLRVESRQVIVNFNGGTVTSDGGVNIVQP